MKKYILSIICLLILPLGVLAAESTVKPEETMTIRPSIRIYNPLTQQMEMEFFPFGLDSKALGLNLATLDLNNDNQTEIIVATGKNEKPMVKIFNSSGVLTSEFLAFAESYISGFKVIAADLYNDKNPEILVAQNEEGTSEIKVFSGQGKLLFKFFAFDEKLLGGASLAVGDVNKDGQMEIIAGAGYQMDPLIKIFDNYGNFLTSFQAYDKKFKGGINVTSADLYNDKQWEIIAAPAVNSAPDVRIFDNIGTLIKTFYAYNPGFGGGVNLDTADLDDDGNIEIITTPGFSGGSHIRFFDNSGNLKLTDFFGYDNFKGGLAVASGSFDIDNQTEIIIGTQTISSLNKYDNYKSLEVDLTKQHIYAYFKGELKKDFIISSGKAQFPTPIGRFKIQTKIPKTRMARFYGPDNPNNYDLPNVPNVMYFYRDYAIHGAYWHWKFGTRVSHGCVNLKLKDAAWAYTFADIGTPVYIYASKK
ncbi:MAG: L,D-transpeptidase family protein [Candidatus Parcubacteria bacterium]|nr:L,D-transpeptidase family protein [Candidatus Parcubacteria bacterium]